MEDLFQQVECRIRSLMRKHAELQKLNTELAQIKKHVIHENERLLAKHKNVTNLVENTIAKLKSIEGLS